MKIIEIYTDGACSNNPGPGGWAAILEYNGNTKEISGYEPDTTNNRMEMMAVIKALETLKYACQAKIYTDSSYVCNAFKQNWIGIWSKNNWLTSNKKPVANKDLWLRLFELNEKYSVEWYKVKGHSTDEKNNRCDKLARQAIKNGESLNQKSDAQIPV